MLVLTPAAVAVVNTLTTAQGWSEDAGLRISAADAPEEGRLQVELAPEPAAQDQVLADSGARVFLDPSAASTLDDKVLDADIDEQGAAHFVLGAQTNDNHTP
ncbi:hypothetical protein ADK67_13675 [Saccharothrix sp. NRRL B-16348]|uniref:hypothetical protein n=1 Tax=Saccharothrix sp. NRRL B-16348 TaxID=1415542 RepID=UPI0006AF6812|nr:hypothetical protein [Saccharothrix sp. NRRL B-16348]KOX27491.1 hypothetical protein ADK67_13675 [Saccharothrix sp. NRRL B-16348]